MKFRSLLAIGGWSVLALAVGHQEQAGKPGHPRFAPASPEQRIMTIQSGYQTAFDDLSEYESRSIPVKTSDGRTVTLKMPKSYPPQAQRTFKLIHNNILRESNVPMLTGTTTYSIQLYPVSELGKPLEAGSLQLDKDSGIPIGEVKASQEKQIVAFAEQALPTVTTQVSYKGQLFGLDAEALPLKISSRDCLSCHGHSKVGDTLAIMVYAIKRNKQ